MGHVGATDAATARIPAGKRVEMEPRLGARVSDRLEAAATVGARDGRRTTISNGQGRANIGVGWVNHLRSRLSGVEEGIRGRVGEEILAPVVSRL
jgi:hypothetical protein